MVEKMSLERIVRRIEAARELEHPIEISARQFRIVPPIFVIIRPKFCDPGVRESGLIQQARLQLHKFIELRKRHLPVDGK
jgi:hypothetical protein